MAQKAQFFFTHPPTPKCDGRTQLAMLCASDVRTNFRSVLCMTERTICETFVHCLVLDRVDGGEREHGLERFRTQPETA